MGWSACDLPEWHRKGAPHKMPLELRDVSCAVRLIGERRASDSGYTRGTIGTGFFVSVPSEAIQGHSWLHLVTANHVIEDQNDLEIQASNPAEGGRLSSPVEIRGWRQPLKDVDLAIAPVFRAVLPWPVMAMRLEQAVLREGMRELFPGSVVYYVGLLDPLDRVMVRSGTVGALDQRGLPLRQYSYPAHLVDCRSYQGFSGSPCFVDIPFAMSGPAVLPRPAPPGVGPLSDLCHVTMLCGMFTAHLTDEPDDGTVSRYGVGIMLRSQEIVEALMTDEARQERAEADREAIESARKTGPRLEPTSISDEFAKPREEVLDDFRRAAGPLRGRNRDPKPKA